MTTEIRIPTILGLATLLAGVVGGVYLLAGQQTFKSRADTASPQEINLVNLSSTSASIYWKTAEPATGFLTVGLTTNNQDQTENDDRDTKAPLKHRLHFVTLNNLRAETSYFYRINSNGVYSGTLSFTTPAPLTPSSTPPLIGTVSEPSLQPATEAIITLSAPNSQTLATITKLSGNFILPLSEIKTEDLTTSYNLVEEGTEITLKIISPDALTEVKLNTPPPEQLPNLVIGQNRRIETVAAPPPTPGAESAYDLNDDGKLDDADRALIRANFFTKPPKLPKADINQDGVVNQSDLSAFNAYLSGLPKTPTPTR